MPSFNVQSNIVTGIKYDSPADIPNLQLWLDAADAKPSNITSLSSWHWDFGGNDYIALPLTNLVFLLNPFTIETWLYIQSYPTGTNTYKIITFRASAGNSHEPLQMYIQSDGRLVLWWSGQVRVTSNQTIPLNTWTHVSMVRRNTTSTGMECYINGQMDGIGSGASSQDTWWGQSTPTIGGHQQYPSKFVGCLSNFRIVKGVAVTPTPSTIMPPLSAVPETVLLTLMDSSLIDRSGLHSGLTTAALPVSPNKGVSWSDKSSFKTNTYAQRPAYGTTLLSSEINGLNVVGFNGTTDYLSLSSRSISISSDYSCFFVYRRPTDGFSTSLGNIARSPTATLMQWYDNTLYGGTAYATHSTEQASLTGVLVASTRKGESFYANRTKWNLNSPWASDASITSVSSVGVFDGSYFHKDAIGEILLTYAKLPDWELNFINNKLMDKWGID